MGQDLFGKQVLNTYDAIIKVGDNDTLTGIAKQLSDGRGNDAPIWLSTARMGIGVTPDSNYTLTVNGAAKIGSLDVTGAVTAASMLLTGGSGSQGLMSWNTDEETVDIVQNGATLQVGQEIQVHVKNQTGSLISDGTPVYVTGTVGSSGRLTVAPMIADGTIEAKYFLGVTTEDIPNGEDGKVTTFGKIRGLNTSAYSEGTTLYVSASTAGAFQTTAPAAPNLDLEVAIVITSHVNNGTIFVRATNGQYLGLLHDVYLSSPANNQFLVYNSTTSRWENQGIASVGSINLDTVTDNGNTTTNDITVGDISAGNMTLSGYLRGAANFVIDPAAYGDETGVVQILGDLRVDGTTTTINSTTVTIDDKNIVLASGSATAADANGSGITIDGAGATMTYNSTSDRFVFNKNIETNLVGNVTGSASLNVLKSGDTMTGDLSISNGQPKLRLKETDTTNVDKELLVSGGSFFIRNINDDNTVGTNIISVDSSSNVTATKFIGALQGNADTASALETARNIAVDGAVTGNADFDGSANITITTSVNHNHDADYVNVTGDTMTGNLDFDDNVKARFGTGNDLSIYHNALHTFIDNDSTSGSLYLRNTSGDGDIIFIASDTGTSVQDYLRISGTDGAVKISNSSSIVLETTATGISVTGEIEATGDVTANAYYGDGSNLTGVLTSLNFSGIDGITLTDTNSTIDSYFHAKVNHDFGLYIVNSNARYGADYIQIDGSDDRTRRTFTISPKDIGEETDPPRLYFGGNVSATAPNTLTTWDKIYFNASEVIWNGHYVATQTWVTNTVTNVLDLQDVTDNGNSTDNSIIISNSVPLYFTNTGTGTYNKGVMYSNTTDGFLFEAPWETDATTTRVPFILTWRGGMGHGGIKLNGDTQLHTNDSGLGVDITSPSAKLHVGGSSIFDGLMTVNDGNNYAKLGDLRGLSTMVLELKDGTNPVQIEAYGEEMRIYQGASLAMQIAGKTVINPDNEVGKGLRVYYDMDLYNTLRLTDAAMTEKGRVAASSSGVLTVQGNNEISFVTNSVGAATFDSSGNLFINGTRRIYLNGTGNYIYSPDGSDLDLGSADDINFRSSYMRFYNASANYEYARLHGEQGDSWLNANGGRVGIGTNTPERLLHVDGEATFRKDVRIYTDTTTHQGGVTMYDPDGGGYLSIAVTDNEHASNWGWQFQSNFADDDTGTTYFRIGYDGADSYLDSGDFGIGTTTPSARLHVYVNSANDDTFHIYNGSVRTHLMASESTNGVIYMRNSSNSNTVRINTSGFTYFNGGNVGIGVVSPDAKLHIQGGNVISNVTDNWHSSSLGTDIIRGGSQQTSISNEVNALKIFPATNIGKSAGHYWGGISFMHLDPETYGSSYTGAQMWIGGRIVDTPGQERSAIVFATNNSTTAGSHPEERMCILPNGTVGIGTTAPPSISSGVPTLAINSPNTNNLSGGFIYQSNGVSKAYHYWENSYLVHQVQGGGHSLNNGGVVLMRVESNGNTKIYASDDSRLTVTDTGDSSNLTMRADANNSIYSNKSLNIYTENADHISFSTNGQSSEKMRITSGGNVGIDVTSPTAKFQVGADQNSNATGVSFCAGSAVNNLIARTTSHHNWFPYADGNNYYSADNHIFRNANHNTEWLKIESNGRVRVNPSLQGLSGGSLWVYYDMKLYNTLDLTDSSFNTQARIAGANGELNLTSNGGSTWGIKINSSGYVGVNKTNPQARLHVGGRIRIDNPSTTGGTNTDQAIYIEHPSLSGEYFTMGFKDTARSGEKMQHPSGAYANSSAFYIECGSTEAGGICLDQDSVHVYGSSDGGATFRVIDKDADVVTFEMLQTSWNGVFRGDVIAYGSMSSISDIRIKENIEPYENVLDKLCSLGVYSYNKITLPEHKRDRKEIGVIAQEVEAVFPELVNEEKVDKPQDANGLEQIKTVDYEHLTAILLQSIKELRNEVEELKATLDGSTY